MTEKMKPTAKNITINGSTLKPAASSVYSFNNEAEEPPKPADLVEVGVCACDWALDLALLRRLMSVLWPPGAADCLLLVPCGHATVGIRITNSPFCACLSAESMCKTAKGQVLCRC